MFFGGLNNKFGNIIINILRWLRTENLILNLANFEYKYESDEWINGNMGYKIASMDIPNHNQYSIGSKSIYFLLNTHI